MTELANGNLPKTQESHNDRALDRFSDPNSPPSRKDFNKGQGPMFLFGKIRLPYAVDSSPYVAEQTEAGSPGASMNDPTIRIGRNGLLFTTL